MTINDEQYAAVAVAQSSPAGLATITSNGKWQPYEHLLEINEYILKLYHNEISKLIVEVPVRHGKSELLSKYTPAWWLGCNPDDKIIFASYEATFAETWGRKARDVLSQYGKDVFGVQVRTQPSSAKEWLIKDHDGIMVSTGIGGSVTGKGADLLLIDDPVKDAAQAQSKVYRNKTWDWWNATIGTRLEANARVCLVMARWHEDDLSGRLQSFDDSSDPWTVLRLPAISEGPDALRQQAGIALCEEMFNLPTLEKKREPDQVGPYYFNALYQQRPSSPAGNRFKRDDFRYWKYIDDETISLQDDQLISIQSIKKYQTIDVAASEKETADFTVVSTFGTTRDAKLILFDSQWHHYSLANVPEFIMKQNDKHNNIPMYIETFGHGLGPYQVLQEHNYPVLRLRHEHGTQEEKESRSFKAVAMYEAHRVFHPKNNKFIVDFEDELISFPNGANDDKVDTLSYAAQLVPSMKAPVPSNKIDNKISKPILHGIMTERF